jgi:integrase
MQFCVGGGGMQALLNSYPVRNPKTAIEYQGAVKLWDHFFAGRPLGEITPADLAAFTTLLLDGRSVATANKIRRHCRALLSWAVELGEIAAVPAWKPLKEPRRAPRAFLVEEFQQVLRTVSDWPGEIKGVEAKYWWRSLLLSIWYSGARISATLQVRWPDVLLSRKGFYVRARYQKQNADQFFVVGEDCVSALRMVRSPERELVWPWSGKRYQLFHEFRRIVEAAGVELETGSGPLFHRLRRSTASYIRAAGGDATAQLGHSCSSVTARYYDPRIVGSHNSVAAMPRLAF